MPETRPNIVLFICDDLAFGDLHCHGNSHTTTAHLDRLHAESARLSRCRSGPVCTPARASVMTGRYPYRTRAIDTYAGRSMIDPGEITLAQVLRDAGYDTCISGKWHLGDCYPMRAMDMGFDEALVHNGGGLRQPGNIGADGYFDPDLMHNGRLTPTRGYCTDIFTDYACAFIRAKRDRPFFLYLATNAPHVPIEVADEWAAPFRAKGVGAKTAGIYGMVENIDHNLGRVLDTLGDAGLEDDTVVIFTSDHGPCGGAREADGSSRFNAGLRDIKGTVYDGGIRVPSFWRWPGRFTPGNVDAVTNPIDILPTLAALAGAKLPDDRAIDGLDLSALLTGQMPRDQWPQRNVFLQWHRGNEPTRYRNYAVIGPRHKLTRPRAEAKDELYDVIADPGEMTDLADKHPDIVRTMRAAYDRWFDDVSAERPDNYDPPRIVVGSPHESPTALTRQDWRIEKENGWADEDAGCWRVRFDLGGAYEVTIRHPKPGRDSVLHMRWQGAQLDLPIRAEAAATQTTITADAGDATIEAWLERGGARCGVNYVSLAARVK